jgi:hypothetical protein
MIDTARSTYPEDMMRAAHEGQTSFASWTGDLVERVEHFTREKPTTALLWALGIGFVLGWKLKPW